MVPGLDVAQLFRNERSWPVGWERVLYNRLRLARELFGAARRQRAIDAMRRNPALPRVIARIDADDTGGRRDRLRALALRDDDWFFQRFGDAGSTGMSAL
jgi:hypothetical protein